MTGGTTKEGLKLLKHVYTVENGWKYGGGHYKRVFPDSEDATHYELEETPHTKYFKMICNDNGIDAEEYLANKPHKEKCICGHDIMENCFIYKKLKNGNVKIKVLGNNCIKELELSGRRCSICNEKHNSKNHNFCKDCKKNYDNTHCKDCGRQQTVGNQRFDYCFLCHERRKGRRLGNSYF